MIEAREYYNLGENLSFSLRNVTTDVVLTVFLLRDRKYVAKIGSEWQRYDSLTTTTLLLTNSLSLGTENYFLVEIPKTMFNSGEFVYIKADYNSQTFEKTVFYGMSLASPSLVTVYGTLFDALGQPMVGETISFQVLNPVTYFDNSPATSIQASTTTNSNGYFSISLNRRYDYLVVLPRLNYSKYIKLSQIPNTQTSVELVFENLASYC